MMERTLVTHQTGPEGKKVKDYILRSIRYRKRVISSA